MNKMLSAAILFLSTLFLAAAPSPGGKGPADDAKKQKKADKDLVYVCACLTNKSCSCMTEAKTEGPCACGTQGGPPLKPVPHDSAWAQENRDALAK
jgi:hypothetical protein